MSHTTEPRVSAAEVIEIMTTTLSVEQVGPFINPANLLVNARLSGKYDEDILKEIVKYLTAHFITGRDPAVKSESIGEAAITYFTTSTVGEGLSSSPYGQRVRLLDYKNILSMTSGIVDIEAYG